MRICENEEIFDSFCRKKRRRRISKKRERERFGDEGEFNYFYR